jgi:acetate kinase
MKILVLNAGSSSQKSRFYDLADALPEHPPVPLWEADADWSEHPGVTELKITTAHSQTHQEELRTNSRPQVIEHLLQTLWSGSAQVLAHPSDLDVVGHRVVHGGPEYHQSTKVTPAVKDAIKRWASIAPVHNLANLEGIEVLERILPSVPQVAVFDTAFHSQMPLPAVVYPVPYEWFEQGIRRYGFHGISHQYCAHRAAQLLGKDLEPLRLITCHLGNGCSLAAIFQGRSIDTTMGFTPLEGLMMGSRSGSVDPGLLLYLLRQKGYSAEQLDTTLNKASGLQGVSGVSNDMREILHAMAQGHTRARLAFDVFVYRLRLYIGAMLAALGGIDALVFTGGIGEHAATIRARVCRDAHGLGLALDEAANQAGGPRISGEGSAVSGWVIPTDENLMVARHTRRLLDQNAGSRR